MLVLYLATNGQGRSSSGTCPIASSQPSAFYSSPLDAKESPIPCQPRTHHWSASI